MSDLLHPVQFEGYGSRELELYKRPYKGITSLRQNDRADGYQARHSTGGPTVPRNNKWRHYKPRHAGMEDDLL